MDTNCLLTTIKFSFEILFFCHFSEFQKPQYRHKTIFFIVVVEILVVAFYAHTKYMENNL